MAYTCISLGDFRNRYGSLPGRFYSFMQEEYDGERSLRGFLSGIREFGDMAFTYMASHVDEEAEVKGFVEALKGRMDGIIAALREDPEYAEALRGKGIRVDYDAIARRVGEALELADRTQFTDAEAAGLWENYERLWNVSTERLDGELRHMFGAASSDLVDMLKSGMGDLMARTCVWNNWTGESIDSDAQLNVSIWRERARAYEEMLGYLATTHPDEFARADLSPTLFTDAGEVPEGELSVTDIPYDALTSEDLARSRMDVANYMDAVGLFRELVLKDRRFVPDYVRASSATSRRETVDAHRASYRRMAEWLAVNAPKEWGAALEAAGLRTSDMRSAAAGNAAYEADRPSRYTVALAGLVGGGETAGVVADMAKALGIDPVAEVAGIMSADRDALVSAVGDYVELTHFDELLENALKGTISIDRELRGTPDYHPGKYSRSGAGSGNIKGYGNDDRNDTVKFTSDTVKTFVSQMRLMSYGNVGAKTTGRLKCDELVNVFSKLVRGIESGKYIFNFEEHEGTKPEVLRRHFRERVLNYNKAQLDNMLWLFRQLFGTPDEEYCGQPIGYETVDGEKVAVYGRTPLVELLENDGELGRNEFLTKHNINVLYSFYRQVADLENPASLAGSLRSRGGFMDRGSGAMYVLNALARYLGVNDRVNWLTTYSDRSGNYDVEVEQGRIQAYDTADVIRGINAYANGDRVDRAALAGRYGFGYRTENDGQTRYFLTLSDGTPIEARSRSKYGMMYGDEQVGDVLIDMSPEGTGMKEYWEGLEELIRKHDGLQRLLEQIDGVDPNMRAGVLDGELLRLYSTLKLFDDYLGLGLLDDPDEKFGVLMEYVDRYGQVRGSGGLDNPLMPFMKMTMRSAYAMSKRLEADSAGMELGDYLRDRRDPLYEAYTEAWTKRGYGGKDRAMKVGVDFSSGACRYLVASNKDGAMKGWAEAGAAWSGTNDSSYIIRDGSTFPRTTVGMFGKNTLRASHDVSRSLNGRRTDILTDIIKSEWDTVNRYRMVYDGNDKAYDDGNTSEYLFNSVIGDCFRLMEEKGLFMFAPASYGGKNTYEAKRVRLDRLRDRNVINWTTARRGDFLDAMRRTIGAYYGEVADFSLQKLGRVLSTRAEMFEGEAERLRAAGDAAGADVASGRAAEIRDGLDVGADGRYGDGVWRSLALVTEEELADAAQETVHVETRNGRSANVRGDRVTRDLDYRIGADGRLVGNELLRMGAEVFGDAAALGKEMERCEKMYVLDFIRNGVYFNVLDKDDLYDYHTGAETRPKDVPVSQNDVYRSVIHFLNKLGYYSTDDIDRSVGQYSELRKSRYFRDWVSRETNCLILAKQGGRDVLGELDFRVDSDEPFELNPMLEYVFMLDNLVSTAFRTFTVGSEFNNPVKGTALFDALRRGGEGAVADFAKASGIKAGKAEVAAFYEELRGMNGVNDVVTAVGELRRSGAGGGARGRLLEELYGREWVNSVAKTFDVNNKRAGGYLSPVKPAMQNMLTGVGREFNVAVYDDMTKEAWNLRSEISRLKAHEGGAFVTAYEHRLENASFVDQASGLQMKTMLYALYDDYGVTDYMKHMATTITNELIRLTEHEDASVTLRGLLKKMTNKQFEKSDSIDLTANWLDPDTRSDDVHVRERMFGNRWMYYEGPDGDRRFIESLGAQDISGYGRMYYTLEGDGTVPEGAMDAEARDAVGRERVYHIFYDRVEGGRVKERSLHMRVGRGELAGTMERLRADGANPHTINSIYELWEALGGMMCCDVSGSVSERNNDIVTNFISYVVRPYKSTSSEAVGNPEMFDQLHFRRLLDKYHGNFLLPASSMKKGVSNINSVQRLNADDPRPFNMFRLKSEIGIQLDEGRELQEPMAAVSSQMLTSTSQGGVMPEVVDEIKGIMRGLAEHEAPGFVETVRAALGYAEEGMESGERAKLEGRVYGMLAKIFSDNIDKRSFASFSQAVRNRIRPELAKSRDHLSDVLYIPFSSMAHYDDFVSTVSSFMTNSVMRLRAPGEAMIIMPSVGIMRLYDVKVGERVIRMTPEDVYRRARDAYRDELLASLRSAGFAVSEGETGIRDIVEYDGATDSIYIGGVPAEGAADGAEAVPLEAQTIGRLQALALRYDPSGGFSEYYTPETDMAAVRRHLSDVYLDRHRRTDAEVMPNREWFAPGDVVDVVRVGLDGRPVSTVETVELDESNYARFKDGIGADGRMYDGSLMYMENVTSSRDLKPRQIRWRYRAQDGSLHWANYFDLEHVRKRFPGGEYEGMPKADYEMLCDRAMNDLFNGKFRLSDGVDRTVDGRLDIREHETVHDNLYPEEFGIRQGDTLADVMEQRREYFVRRWQDRLRAPASGCYDIAFLRTRGNPAYVMFGTLPESLSASEEAWEGEQTLDNNEIWITRQQRPMYRVARWVDAPDSGIVIRGGELASADGRPFERSRYRIGTDRQGNETVQERVDLVRRYVVLRPETDKAGREVTRRVTVLNVADYADFRRAYYDAQYSDRMLAETVADIYREGGYDTAEISEDAGRRETYRNAMVDSLGRIGRAVVKTGAVRGLIDYQIDILNGVKGKTWRGYFGEKKAWYNRLANEIWASFQDSAKVMMTRIPAAGMMSYMPGDTAAWMGGRSNRCFVSHMQLYYQGSDMDADEAHFMGQSYDAIGRYVGWSPLFDTGSLATLEASKRLPVPGGRNVRPIPYGVPTRVGKGGREVTLGNGQVSAPDVTRWLGRVAELGVIDGGRVRVRDKANVSERVEFIESLSRALYAMRPSGGRFKYDGTDTRLNPDMVEAIRATLQSHESHIIPEPLFKKAYLNALQANVMRVSSDPRNAVASSVITTTSRFDRAAMATIKGRESLGSSPFVPSRKYVQIHDDRMAGQDIGIVANGSKLSDVVYQHFALTLDRPSVADRDRLFFDVELEGIDGRSRGEIRKSRINHIPDLNMGNERIVRALESMYDRYNSSDGVGDGRRLKVPDFRSERPARVKEMISELLNISTDDGKLHDLEKVNGYPELISNYVTMFMLGFGIEDAVAFMTTPYVNEVVKDLYGNMYANDYSTSRLDYAVNAAIGRISAERHLKGYFKGGERNDEEHGSFTPKTEVVRDHIAAKLNYVAYKGIGDRMRTRFGVGDGETLAEKGIDIDDLVYGFIVESASGVGLKPNAPETEPILLSDIYGEIGTEEEYKFVKEVDRKIRSVRAAALRYGARRGASFAERCENGVRSLRRDMDNFVRLKELTDELTTLSVGFLSMNQGEPKTDAKRISRIRSMERAVKDRERAVGISGVKVGGTAGRISDASLDELTKLIRERSPHFQDGTVRRRLSEAYRLGIIKGFDMERAALDDGYMDAAVNYLDMIKGFVNTLDVVRHSPEFWGDVRLFIANEKADEMSSVMNRLVKRLARDQFRVDERMMRRLKRVAGDILTMNYFGEHQDITLGRQARGFEKWLETDVSMFEMRTDEGLAGFSRFVTSVYMDELRASHPDNGFLRNIKCVERDGREVWTPAFDIREESGRKYEMETGLRELAKISFDRNTDYTVADILYMYNLIENGNRTGRDVFTPLFSVLDFDAGEMGRYNRWISSKDRDSSWMPLYSVKDVEFALADRVEEDREKFSNARSIVSVSPTGVETPKRLNTKYGTYSTVQMESLIDREEDPRLQKAMRRNYMTWSPFRMPEYMARSRVGRTLMFEEGKEESLKVGDIRRLIVNRSVSGYSHFVVQC